MMRSMRPMRSMRSMMSSRCLLMTTVYEDNFVEYRLGGVRFNVTEGTDVLDRQDVYWANMNEQSTDQAGNECNICVYPMFTVKHRVIISPMIDELI